MTLSLKTIVWPSCRRGAIEDFGKTLLLAAGSCAARCDFRFDNASVELLGAVFPGALAASAARVLMPVGSEPAFFALPAEVVTRLAEAVFARRLAFGFWSPDPLSPGEPPLVRASYEDAGGDALDVMIARCGDAWDWRAEPSWGGRPERGAQRRGAFERAWEAAREAGAVLAWEGPLSPPGRRFVELLRSIARDGTGG